MAPNHTQPGGWVKPPQLEAVDDLDGEVTHIGFEKNKDVVFVRYSEWSPSMVVCFYGVNTDRIDFESKTLGQELRRALERHDRHYLIPLSVYSRYASEETIVAPAPESVLLN